MSHRLIRALFVAGTIILTAAGRAPAAEPGAKTLHVAFQTDISSFDPDNSFEVAGLSAVNGVYEGLVGYAPGTTEIKPLLAKSWTVSADGKTYTFSLRDDVVFHDGKPMTADDVLGSFKRRTDKSLTLWYFLWNAKAMSAPDPRTFVLELKFPQPSLLDTMASPWGPKVVAPAARVDHAGSDNAKSWLNAHADGTGPFKLAAFNPGQGYQLIRNDAYWGPKAHFAIVDIAVLPDMGQQILKLRAGELDAILSGYPPAQLATLPKGFAIHDAKNFSMVIGFLNPSGALAKPELRRAVMTALNPKFWLADAFGNYAIPALSLYPSAMLKPATPIAFPDDLAAARKIVAAAGPTRLSIVYTADKAGTVRQPVELMLAQLQSIGIEASARVVPSGEPYGYAKKLGEAPDMLVTRVNPDAAHPETQATVFFTKGGPVNYFGFSDPEADTLVKEAGGINDRAAADKLYEKASDLIIASGGFIPFAELKETIVARVGLTNVETRPSFPPGNVDFALIDEK